MIKKFFKSTFVACATISLMLVSCGETYQANYEVIPLPKEVTPVEKGSFKLSESTVIYCPAEDAVMEKNAQLLAQYIEQSTGMKLQITNQLSSNAIVLFAQLENENPEAYTLTVSSDEIVIKGASAAGCFYGIQTLRKSLPVAEKASSVEMPAVEIADAPRFSYRGAHFDVSRHFFTVDEVKCFIDMLALHNINRLHWHLTDDQGWRIEIKKYPRLAEVGGFRPETVIGRNTGRYDGTPHQGFYTQDEIRDVIAYAAERHITIVPEIDLPGHMQAALAGYPEFGCTGGPYKVWQDWGVSDNVLCAGNDATMQFIKDVLNEVVDLFPSEYIHVGGDECPKDQWKKCPKCQQRIRKEGLRADKKHTAEERLQSYVISFAERVLNERGRKMIGWDEVLEGGLAPNATVMSWRGEGGGIEAARMKHNVIMTPNTYCYFDYYQTADKNSAPLAIGGFLPIERVYSYEPMPKQLEPEYHGYITGVQANLWTEYIPTFSHAQYMELPRMAALSEVQWLNAEQKDFDAFVKRLPRLIDLYEKLGYNYAKHVFEVQPTFTTDTVNHAVVATYKTIDDGDVYYTLDGTDPTMSSALYKEPVTIKESCTIKATTFRNGEATNIATETFQFSKSTGCPVVMLQPINDQYEYAGAITLVDGLLAPDTNYQTGRWIAFYRNDMEAVIDLGEATSVSNVKFNVCVEKGAWIFNAREVEISVSEDGANYTSVVKKSIPAQTESEPNEVYVHSYDFEPANARFVKVKATPEHSMPAWHGGKGSPAFLFVDEISVN